MSARSPREADRLRQRGCDRDLFAHRRKPPADSAIADPIKATTPEALAALKDDGIRVVMLTGDNATAAKRSPQARHRRGRS